MRVILQYFINFMILFLSILLIYIFLINGKRKSYESLKKTNEVTLFIDRYKLNMKKIKYKELITVIAIINSFIIAITATIIMDIESIMFSLLVGFVIIFSLTYISYELLGKYYTNKSK